MIAAVVFATPLQLVILGSIVRLSQTVTLIRSLALRLPLRLDSAWERVQCVKKTATAAVAFALVSITNTAGRSFPEEVATFVVEKGRFNRREVLTTTQHHHSNHFHHYYHHQYRHYHHHHHHH